MNTLRYTIKTSIQKIFNAKMAVFCAVFFILSWTYDQPYLQFVKEKKHPISWCIFPFYMTSFSILSIFYLGIIYIHSDVPFMHHINMYQVIRTGRWRWALGQLGGIGIRSFFSVVMFALAAALPFVGHIEFSAEWGKVIKTVASQRASEGFWGRDGQMVEFRFFYEILNEYTPIQLMTLTILLCTLICTFLGILMFALSIFAGKIIAVAGGMVFVAALFFVENIYGRGKMIAAYFVPTYWAEIALSKTPVSGYYRLPPLTYMFAFLSITILLMAAAVCWKVKRMEFQWENEDE